MLNVFGLAGLVATAQHKNDRTRWLYVIHAPTRAKEFTHLKHAVAHRFDVAQRAASRFIQPAIEPNPSGMVFQAGEPVAEE